MILWRFFRDFQGIFRGPEHDIDNETLDVSRSSLAITQGMGDRGAGK